jgi:hypothetical protein
MEIYAHGSCVNTNNLKFLYPAFMNIKTKAFYVKTATIRT